MLKTNDIFLGFTKSEKLDKNSECISSFQKKITRSKSRDKF